MTYRRVTIITLLVTFPLALAPVRAAESDLFARVQAYEFGQPRTALIELEKQLADAAAEGRVALEARMLEVLRSKDATRVAKDGVCRLLRQYGSARAIPALAKLLTDEELSHAARFALLPRTEPAAGQSLRDALDNASDKLKVGLIGALADRRDQQAVPQLAKLSASSNRELAAAALRGLGRIGDAAAARALEQAQVAGTLADARRHALLDCAESILDAGQNKDAAALYAKFALPNEPVTIRIAAYRGLARAQQEMAAPTVLALLRDENPRLQKAAAGLIVAMPGRKATAAFADELPKLAPEARVVLLGALATRGDGAARPQVLRAARAGETSVRVAALRALATLGDASCVAELARAAGEPDNAVRQAARETLERLPGDGVDRALAQRLKEDRAEVRLALLTCLVNRRADGVMAPLLAHSRDADDGVRREAQKGLADFAGAEHLPALFTLLAKLEKDADRQRVEKAVRAAFERGDGLPPERRERVLLAAWREAQAPSARASILALLAEQGGAAALQAIAGALKDKDERVQDAAVSALAAWPDAAPQDTLRQLAKSATTNLQRLKALRGYVRTIGLSPQATPRESTPLYEGALKLADGADARKQVFIALAESPSPAAREFVESHLNDADVGDAGVGAEAKNAKLAIKKLLARTIVLENEATLDGKLAALHGDGIDYEARADRQCIGNWHNPQGWASWDIYVAKPGVFTVEVLQAKQGAAGGKYEVSVGDKKLKGAIKNNNSWSEFATVSLGEVKIDRAGQCQVAIRAPEAPAPVMNLRAIVLKRK